MSREGGEGGGRKVVWGERIRVGSWEEWERGMGVVVEQKKKELESRNQNYCTC